MKLNRSDLPMTNEKCEMSYGKWFLVPLVSSQVNYLMFIRAQIDRRVDPVNDVATVTSY